MKMNFGQKMTTMRDHKNIIDQKGLKDQTVPEEERDPEALAGIETMKTLDKTEAEGEIGKREDSTPGKEARGDSTLVLNEVDAQRPLVMVGLLQATP